MFFYTHVLINATGNFKRAKQLLVEMKKKITGKNKIYFHAAAFHSLGQIENYKSNYARALYYYKHALNYFLQVGKKQDVASQYNEMGLVYINMGELDIALSFF